MLKSNRPAFLPDRQSISQIRIAAIRVRLLSFRNDLVVAEGAINQLWIRLNGWLHPLMKHVNESPSDNPLYANLKGCSSLSSYFAKVQVPERLTLSEHCNCRSCSSACARAAWLLQFDLSESLRSCTSRALAQSRVHRKHSLLNIAPLLTLRKGVVVVVDLVNQTHVACKHTHDVLGACDELTAPCLQAP